MALAEVLKKLESMGTEQTKQTFIHHGQTACKVPLATEYIEKVKAIGRIGTKKKTCIC